MAEFQAVQDRLKDRMAAAKLRERELLKQSRRQQGRVNKKPRLEHSGKEGADLSTTDDEFLPIDRADSNRSDHLTATDGVSPEVRALMNQ